jgi:outer membrane protein OmpA-like peptidoglycan-associated protein
MKTSRIFLLAGALTFAWFAQPARAQFGGILDNVKEHIEKKAEEKVEQKIDEKSDDAVDNATDENGNAKSEDNNSSNTSSTGKASKASASLSSYSKFDFIPGNKVLVYDDLSNTAVGDFPASWNTNGSGEVVTTNLAPGTWFKAKPNSHYAVPAPATLPENATIEFDVLHNGFYAWDLVVGQSKGSSEMNSATPGDRGIQFMFHTNAIGKQNWTPEAWGESNWMTTEAMEPHNKVIRVSIWRQGERVRLYIDGQKIFDLPKLMPKGGTYDRIQINSNINEDETLLFSNFRIAEGAPDMRSKLVTDGRISTTGITFAVNSDVINVQSAGVLKSVADALKANPTINVKIVGHTDADGEASKNLDLSKRRATSVKNALVKDYGIEEARLTTDGMGATQLVDKGTTPEAKANNRRVEFIKQ